MRIIRRYAMTDRKPWYMGAVYWDLLRFETVAAPIGVNLILAFGRFVWLWMVYTIPRAFQRWRPTHHYPVIGGGKVPPIDTKPQPYWRNHNQENPK